MFAIGLASIPAAIQALIVGWPVTALTAPPKDWSKVPVKYVKLLYPGQSTRVRASSSAGIHHEQETQ